MAGTVWCRMDELACGRTESQAHCFMWGILLLTSFKPRLLICGLGADRGKSEVSTGNRGNLRKHDLFLSCGKTQPPKMWFLACSHVGNSSEQSVLAVTEKQKLAVSHCAASSAGRKMSLYGTSERSQRVRGGGNNGQSGSLCSTQAEMASSAGAVEPEPVNNEAQFPQKP